MSVLLIIVGSILGYLIALINQATTTNQQLLIAVTELRRDRVADNDRLARVENDITRVEKALVYNLNTRLTYVEAKTGAKAPTSGQQREE